MQRYSLDANVFLEAQLGPYPIDLVPQFWNWLDANILLGNFFSATMVYDEVTQGDPDLTSWIKERKDSLFEDPSIEAQKIVVSITSYVYQNYEQEQADKFLEGADPFVIAQASAANAIVVTNEKKVGINSKKVKIPNICEEFDVDWIGTYRLMRKLNAKFK